MEMLDNEVLLEEQRVCSGEKRGQGTEKQTQIMNPQKAWYEKKMAKA